MDNGTWKYAPGNVLSKTKMISPSSRIHLEGGAVAREILSLNVRIYERAVTP
jgi:hypothetical protein